MIRRILTVLAVTLALSLGAGPASAAVFDWQDTGHWKGVGYGVDLRVKTNWSWNTRSKIARVRGMHYQYRSGGSDLYSGTVFHECDVTGRWARRDGLQGRWLQGGHDFRSEYQRNVDVKPLRLKVRTRRLTVFCIVEVVGLGPAPNVHDEYRTSLFLH